MKKIIKNRKSNLKTVWDIIYGIVFIFLLFIAGIVTLSMFDIPGGIKLYTVQSGSMEPTIKTSSLIVSKLYKDYQIGDIITFKSPGDKEIKNPKLTTTHRIIEKKFENDQIFFATKGDANNVPDFKSVSLDLVLGKTVFVLPFMGYPVSFAKTQNGLILLVVIPATVIVYSELLSIKKEALKLIEKRKKRKLTTKEKVEVQIAEEEMLVERWYERMIKKVKAYLRSLLLKK
jgi:signal peptidase